jgi:hypothetical protein
MVVDGIYSVEFCDVSDPACREMADLVFFL